MRRYISGAKPGKKEAGNCLLFMKSEAPDICPYGHTLQFALSSVPIGRIIGVTVTAAHRPHMARR